MRRSSHDNQYNRVRAKFNTKDIIIIDKFERTVESQTVGGEDNQDYLSWTVKL